MPQNKLIKRSLIVCTAVTVFFLTARTLQATTSANPVEHNDPLNAAPEDIQAWRDMKFGLFVHWGPMSLMGTEIGWSRGGQRRGREGRGEIPVEVYDNLYRSFYPQRFDAKEWVAVAKAAGMRYLVFTTKHHDGFCMFDSAMTDYKITNGPFKRDVVKELADACHEGGLKLGFYYSQPDWYHPDYRTENHSRYIEYLHAQLRELCTNYGKVDIIFFDGLGGKAQDWDSQRLIPMVRRLQRHVIINNRTGLPADYDTPEQRIGKFTKDRPWESCITICRQWAWKPGDKMKSLKQCIETLVRVAGGDGNFLLNVGPMPTGQIEPRQVARLNEMGRWLSKYGQSIYGTRGGPFIGNAWCASTNKGNRIYVHIFAFQGQSFRLPAIKTRIIAGSLLTGGQVQVRQNKDGIVIIVPQKYQRPIDTIVVLDVDGPAGDIAPVELVLPSLAYGCKPEASTVYENRASDAADKAFDNDFGTCWRSEEKQAWLEVDLGRAMTVGTAMIWDGGDYFGAEKLELQYKVDDKWQPIAETVGLVQPTILKFEPVKAQHFRLNVSRENRQVRIYEFQLFGPEE